MKLKKIILPKQHETEEQLYYRRDELTGIQEDGSLALKMGAEVGFDTYFNSFSAGVWKKYSVVDQAQITLKLTGTFLVELMWHHMKGKKVVTKKLSCHKVKDADHESFTFSFGELPEEGMLYFRVIATEENGILHEGYYGSRETEPVRDDVHVLADICTFKREEYVYRNLRALHERIIDNPDSLMYGRLFVHISDNAKTLDTSVADGHRVKITPNRNVGGVGGFTRGIIDGMQRQESDGITHALLMDDDALLEPGALETTYVLLTVLKPEYQEHTVAGGIIQLDRPHFQIEEGAQWNIGDIAALNARVDLREIEVLLKNEIEDEKVEYTGWWYCCIPLAVVDEDNLPLPIFIHRDDVEYGLRTGKGFIYMNGMGVWHEAFENKIPGPLDYYDIRNMCIVNAIHYPEYGARQFQKIFTKWVIGNIWRSRYQYVQMNMRAVDDFLKGFDWFIQQEAEPLHKEICAMNYKAKPISSYFGYRGLKEEDCDWEKLTTPEKEDYTPAWKKALHLLLLNGTLLPAKRKSLRVSVPYNNIYRMFRVSEAIFVDANGNAVFTKKNYREMIRCYRMLLAMNKRISKEYDQAKMTYHDQYRRMTNLEFWKKYLEMEQ